MRRTNNPWKNGILGLLGGAAGVMAMDYYFKNASSTVSNIVKRQKVKLRQSADGAEEAAEQEQADDGETVLPKDISLFGRQARRNEVSTAALGRIIYTRLTGEEPQSEETKQLLSLLVHWAYGMGQGGVYGALQGDADFPDIEGGIAFGFVLEIVGDEIVVPMLGLQEGPGSVSAEQWANRVGAHLAYGVATAAVTQALRRIL